MSSVTGCPGNPAQLDGTWWHPTEALDQARGVTDKSLDHFLETFLPSLLLTKLGSRYEVISELVDERCSSETNVCTGASHRTRRCPGTAAAATSE